MEDLDFSEQCKYIKVENITSETKTIVDFVKELKNSFETWIETIRDVSFSYLDFVQSAELLYTEDKNSWTIASEDEINFKVYEEGDSCFDYIMYRLLVGFENNTESFIWYNLKTNFENEMFSEDETFYDFDECG